MSRSSAFQQKAWSPPTVAKQLAKPDLASIAEKSRQEFFATEVYSSSASTQGLNASSAPRRANAKRPYEVFLPIQEWEGFVTDIAEPEFAAVIYRLPRVPTVKPEIMRFDFDDETMGDKALIKPGAIFRWLIGYQVTNGVKSKQSQVIFRRLPGYTKTDQANADAMAANLKSIFRSAEIDAGKNRAE